MCILYKYSLYLRASTTVFEMSAVSIRNNKCFIVLRITIIIRIESNEVNAEMF